MPAERGGAAGAGWRGLGGGARGAGPEAGPLPGAGAAGARKGVASSWSGVGGSGGHGWQQFGDGELGSGTAGGSELGQGLIRAVRARGCRCSLGSAEEGSRPVGEVQLACGVPPSTTDGPRDKSVRKDRASPGESAGSQRVDESLKRRLVGAPWPQRRRALTSVTPFMEDRWTAGWPITSPPKPLEIDALSPAGGVSGALAHTLNSLPGETSG